MKRTMFILLMVTLFSCQYNTHLTFNETQCSNPWESSHNATTYIQNIKHYLWLQGVETGDVTIDEASDSLAFCEACNCPSGRVIHINIMDEDKAKAIDLGFQE